MDIPVFLGNVVWALAAILIVVWAVNLFKRIVKWETVGWHAVFPIGWGILALAVTALTDFSKFHLFWMIPLGVIFPLALLGLKVWSQFKDMGASFKEAMAEMAARVEKEKQIYAGPLMLTDARPEEFSRLDLAWYDEAARELEDVLGARQLADMEVTTLTEIFPEMQTFVRTLSAEDGKLLVSIHNIRVCDPESGELIADYKTYEFETAFTDGTFLQTGNCEGVNNDGDCEGIRVMMLEPEEPWQEVLRVHRETLAELENEESLIPAPITTKEELVEAKQRQHEFRRKAKQEEWAEMEEDFDDEDFADEDDR